VTQLKFIAILERVRQVGGQTLSVEEGAIGTADVLDQVRGTALMDLAMMTGDASLQSSIRAEVQVRENAVG
jgi:hypothetical protein